LFNNDLHTVEEFMVVEQAASLTQPRGQLHRSRQFLILGLALLFGTSCSKGGPDTAQAAPSAIGNDPAIPEVLATVGGAPVTRADVRNLAGDQLDLIESQYRKQKSKIVQDALDAILRERVIDAEAKKQGKTVEALILAEAGGSYDPTDVDIETWYKENSDRLGNRSLDQLRSQIADLLRKQNREDAAVKLQDRLNKERKVVVNYEPFRIAFNNGKAPTLGKAGAPVQVVEFSDFQCPFCRRFYPSVHEVAKNYGDKVEVIYRQFPIPSLHPNAIKAAEASLCARDQGKFWELHDMMFAEQETITVSDLKQKAVRLGMNGSEFNKCLDTGKYTEEVQNDMKEGTRAGITGTPAVFVNGIEVPGGAVPYGKIAAAIDLELAKAGKTN
jgi:protein-disulfide isomerase